MAARKILVYGGKGALGSVCVNHFKSKGWNVGSIDLVVNESADFNAIVKKEGGWVEQEQSICSSVEEWVKDGDKLDAIVCVAGGWAGGNAAAKDFIKSCDLMCKQSVWTSAIAAYLASKYLKEGGLLVLTGAQPALTATPGMIGYGMAKASVHHLVKSLATDAGGLPANSTVLAILPVTLDTPMNRKFMPNSDFTKWTPLEFVATLFSGWVDDKNRPSNGSLLQLITKEGKTELVPTTSG